MDLYCNNMVVTYFSIRIETHMHFNVCVREHERPFKSDNTVTAWTYSGTSFSLTLVRNANAADDLSDLRLAETTSKEKSL